MNDMNRPIEILPIIVDKARKASPSCLRHAKNNLERHQLGFDGEHIGSQVLKGMGYKGIRTTRHKSAVDIITSKTVWEVKAVSNGAKDWKMTVKTHQQAKKIALAKKLGKDLKSMLIVMNDMAEVYIRNGVGGFRHTTMKKVKAVKDWRKTYGHGASHRLIEKETVARKGRAVLEYKELDFGEKGTGRSHWSVARFIKKRETLPKKYQPFLTPYSEKEYKKMGARVFLSDSAKSGYAIDRHGDLISVFSLPGAHEGPALVQNAILNGAKKLDAFDCGFLPDFYKKFGFKETSRITWSDKFAPAGWNYKKNGRPDIVFMDLKKGKKAKRKTETEGPTEAFIQDQKDFVEFCLGPSQCDSCKHYQSEDLCKAFPNGIPLDIMANEFIHDDLHPEQETNILFEQRTSKDGN